MGFCDINKAMTGDLRVGRRLSVPQTSSPGTRIPRTSCPGPPVRLSRSSTHRRSREYSKGVAVRQAQANAANIADGKGLIQINEEGESVALKDLKHLKEFFDGLDINQDGTISLGELSKYFSKLYPVEVDKNAANLKGVKRNAGVSLVTQLEQRMQDPEAGGITFMDVIKMIHPNADKEGLMRAVDIFSEKPPKGVQRDTVAIDPVDMSDVSDMWDCYDTKRQGFLHVIQLRELFQDFGMDIEGADEEQWEEYMEQIQKDAAGAVSKAIFVDWWFKDL